MNQRIEDVFLQEQLTEIEPVGDDDKIMATLSPEKTKIWEDIVAVNAEGAIQTQELLRLERHLVKLKKLFESKQFLFWHEIEQADERFESAVQRGKMLAIKKDPEQDGKLVVVEFDAPQQNIGGALFIMPPPEELE